MEKAVFISSTFEDLQTHRRKVWDLLEDYDVNIRGMERFGARKESPLQTCLAEVEQCDIFIGIIAFKLGTVDKSTGKSFTQREYERAYELEKEIFIYSIDEKNSKITYQDIDFDEKKGKLLSFKSILKERHTVDFFVSDEDLKAKLKRKFDELLQLKKQEEEMVEDGYLKSKEIIERFLLLPKTYSGHEIKLKVDFLDSPFSASKAICTNFNLEYGRTIGVKVKIKSPALGQNFVDYVFVDEANLNRFFALEGKTDVEIYSKLEFSENSIDEARANFIRKVYYTGDILMTSIKGFSDGLERNILGERTVVDPEGTIIARLTKFVH